MEREKKVSIVSDNTNLPYIRYLHYFPDLIWLLDQFSNNHYSISAMKKEVISLTINARDAKEKSNGLRKAGSVPGVIYGKVTNAKVKCSGKDLQNVHIRAGENTLVDVDFDGQKLPCLIHAVSYDPVSSKIDHVDFYAVDMTKKVTAHVPVFTTGESPAVKAHGGMIVIVHGQLEVSCLPADLPSGFTVDISTLENLHDTVTVASLKVPTGVTLKNSPETVILTVQEPRKEEVVEPLPGAVPVEGAVPADGTAPATGAPGAAAPAATKKPDDKVSAGKDKAPAKK